ncbi:YrzE family protein [Microbacterium mangrovi]|uniref:YrzE family protein n=1 Tax=Microbacterium mangrovi TaxID=1348253 RepID=UPI001E5DF094|nr:YrzE family protein [Microbacterium mangrovi]
MTTTHRDGEWSRDMSENTPQEPRRPGEAVPGEAPRAETVPDDRTHPLRRDAVPADDAHPVRNDTVPVDDARTLREEVLERERSRFGGMKFGSAFFGWLTAAGTGILLTALVAAAGAAVGLGRAGGSAQGAANQANANAPTVGIIGAIALVVILFVAYFCGGYVAGRMARFDGAKQGVAVWLWALIIAVIVAIVGLIFGSQYNILGNLNSFPRIPLNEGALTLSGILTAIIVALVSLGGAILGGISGMRYHRRVDRVGLVG